MNHRKALTGNVVFWFIDESDDRIEHLKTELKQLNLPPHFIVKPETGYFHEKLSALLDNLDKKQVQVAPTFAFIDPFGFSGVPFALIKRLLSKPRCEVLITFMVDSINRWIDHPGQHITNHIAELFGTPDSFDIIKQSTDRITALCKLYQEQLRREAKHVRYFEMLDYDNRVIYYLYFATNNRLGYVKMKEAMWEVDLKGEFRFSDATNPYQKVLFEPDPSNTLWPILQQHFTGQEVLTDLILRFVEEDTAFLETHMKATLKKHLDVNFPTAERITVRPEKVDGKKWIKGTFPSGVFVKFP